jgi:hypothetical protein
MTFWVMTSLNLVSSYKFITGKCWGGLSVEVSPSMVVCISIKKVKETLKRHTKQFQTFIHKEFHFLISTLKET